MIFYQYLRLLSFIVSRVHAYSTLKFISILFYRFDLFLVVKSLLYQLHRIFQFNLCYGLYKEPWTE